MQAASSEDAPSLGPSHQAVATATPTATPVPTAAGPTMAELVVAKDARKRPRTMALPAQATAWTEGRGGEAASPRRQAQAAATPPTRPKSGARRGFSRVPEAAR